jgi:hypothetical protein
LRSRLIYSGIVNADNNWTKILLADCLRCAVLTQPAFFSPYLIIYGIRFLKQYVLGHELFLLLYYCIIYILLPKNMSCTPVHKF